MAAIPSRFKTPLLVIAVGSIGTGVALRWLDAGVAQYFEWGLGYFGVLGFGLGSAVLIIGEIAVAVSLVIVRLVAGHLSDFNRAIIVAALTSVSTYAANDAVLKIVFGMAPPSALVRHAADHHFHFLAGQQNGSFPSGHMALAMSFSIVMMTLHPRTRRVLIPLLAMAAAALIVGDWHFVSDVIAGSLVGYASGWLAANLYEAHYRREV